MFHKCPGGGNDKKGRRSPSLCFSWLARAQFFLCLVRHTKGSRIDTTLLTSRALSRLLFLVSCSTKSLSIFPPENAPSCSSNPPDILWGQEQGAFTPPLPAPLLPCSPALSCSWMCPLLCPHFSFAAGEELHTRTTQAFPSPFPVSVLPAIFRAFPILSSLDPAPDSQDSASVHVLDVAPFLQRCFLAHLPGHALLQGVTASQMQDFAIPFLQLGAARCTAR